MPWYEFSQNNSFGRYDLWPEKGVGVFVVIEAPSEDAARARAEELGMYFDGVESGADCPCCGDRWYTPRVYEFPAHYGKEIVKGEPFEAEFFVGDTIYVHPLKGGFWSVEIQ
jgi:hypothetical protein